MALGRQPDLRGRTGLPALHIPMIRFIVAAISSLSLVLLAARPASAQLTGFKASKQFRLEQVEKGHWRATGAVEAEAEDGTLVYADQIDVFDETHRAIAVGNVVVQQSDNLIAADRAELDTETGLGTFYNASGSASIANRVKRDMFGSQDADVYFYGRTIEKIGPKKYKITKGGFTTCLQPTPRWEMTSTTAVINVDHYATAKNTLLKVKSVPVLYTPIIYYPINKEDRATGFLMPAYGSSTLRGFTLNNAFFWAINRSQDATFMYDWFKKTGQGLGGEYRYVRGPGADGNFRVYWLKEHEATYEDTVTPARKSYQIRGAASQPLGLGLRFRGNVDYFSDVTVQQTYNMNIYDASRRSRGFGANVSGAWGLYSLNGSLVRNETFFGTTDTFLTGGFPRVSFNRALQRLGSAPLFFAVSSEYAQLLYARRTATSEFDSGLARIDFSPQLRAPFRRWQFLTIDSAIQWRATHYSESIQGGIQVPEPLWRSYIQASSTVTGPVFNRVWVTPQNGYADRFKHVIEPTFSISRVTAIDNYGQIPKIDGLDYQIGGTTRIAYGLVNRFLAKRRGGPAGSTTEFLTVSIKQSYYSNPAASQYDYSFSTSFRGRPPSNYSPIQLEVGAKPTERVNGAFRVEYDQEIRGIQSISAVGSVAASTWLQAGAGWSQRRLTDQFQLDNYLYANVSLRTSGNRVGGTYSFNYDLARGTFLQNHIVGYYNAQCCGFAVEYQTFNFPQGFGYPVSQDRRFNVSVTLAGLGTFSNIFGVLGGSPK
jgi:LPS-assembly protein